MIVVELDGPVERDGLRFRRHCECGSEQDRRAQRSKKRSCVS